jgi:hypothetical protein
MNCIVPQIDPRAARPRTKGPVAHIGSTLHQGLHSFAESLAEGPKLGKSCARVELWKHSIGNKVYRKVLCPTY